LGRQAWSLLDTGTAHPIKVIWGTDPQHLWIGGAGGLIIALSALIERRTGFVFLPAPHQLGCAADAAEHDGVRQRSRQRGRRGDLRRAEERQPQVLQVKSRIPRELSTLEPVAAKQIKRSSAAAPSSSPSSAGSRTAAGTVPVVDVVLVKEYRRALKELATPPG